MEIDFASEMMRWLETERVVETRLPVAAIKAARRSITILRAAADTATLANWKSFRREQLDGRLESVLLNDDYRMIFEINPDPPPTVILMDIERRAA